MAGGCGAASEAATTGPTRAALTPAAPAGALLVALALLLAPLSTAAERLALVVGNDAYQRIPALANARNDARLMAALLREARFDVTLLENAGRAALWRALEGLKGRIRKGDEVVVYFGGHGVQVGADPILLPVDIATESEHQIARDGVPLHKVQDLVRDARVALLVIDACRNNPFPRKGVRSAGEPDGLAPIEAADGVAILMSAARGQTALDSVPGGGAANGLFTHVLVQALRNPAVGVRAALLDTRDRVESEAARVGHVQRPSLVDEMRGDFRIFAGLEAAHAGAAATVPAAPAAPGGVVAGAPLLDRARPPLGGGAKATPPVPPAPPPVRKVQLLWDVPRAGLAGFGAPMQAEAEAELVRTLQAAGIAMTLPAAPDAPIAQRIAAAQSTSSHLLRVETVVDGRSPLGVGFQLSMRSTAAQDLVLSRYTLALPAAPAPRHRFVATEDGFRKVEVPSAPLRGGDVGRTLAEEIRDAVRRALE